MSESSWSKLTTFVANNRVVVLAAVLAVTAATSVVVYQSTLESESSSSGKAAAGGSLKSSSKKSSKKKKKNGSAKGSAKANGTTSGLKEIAGYKLTHNEKYNADVPEISQWEELDSLPKEKRLALGNAFKEAGNGAFKNGDYDEAIGFYSDAHRCWPSEPIYLSNRAACYSKLEKYQEVIADTTAALEIDPSYSKCLSRKAQAYEKLGEYGESAYFYTCACITTSFADSSITSSVDRVLKLGAEGKAKKILESRPKDKLPGSAFVTAYLNAFRKQPLPEALVSAAPGTGDFHLKLALDLMSKKNAESYELAVDELVKAVEAEDTTEKALAYEYLGTFRFLMNDFDAATTALETSIKLKPSATTWTKLASVHMEQGNLMQANLDFSEGLKVDPLSPDIYYHRGQISFLTSDFAAAVRDYTKSIELEPTFVFVHIQLAVTKYRMGNTSEGIEDFKKLIEKFPDVTDVYTYYGEILTDLQKSEEAIKYFDKAIDLETKKKNGDINILPFINKAMAVVQSSHDVSKAEELCRKAVTLDPASDIAIGTLANLCLQIDKTDEALKLFQRNLELLRTEAEIIQCLQYIDAASVHVRIAEERPDLRKRMEIASRAAALEQQRQMGL